MAAASEERRDVSDSSPSHSSLPLPDGPPPSLPPHSDVSAPSLPPPDGSPSDGPAPLHESPPPPRGGPAVLGVSSPAGGTASFPVVPASGQPPPTLSQYTAVTHNMLQPDPPPPASDSMLKKMGLWELILPSMLPSPLLLSAE